VPGRRGASCIGSVREVPGGYTTPFLEIAAKHETIIFIDGDDMVRGERVHDPEHGWIGQVDWSTQDVWESYPARRRRSWVKSARGTTV
jgi:hypothetical protein